MLEAAINKILLLNSNQNIFLTKYQGKVVKIEITDLKIPIYVVLRAERIYLFSDYTNPPDAKIKGTSLTLCKQLMGSKEETTLQIEGNIDLVQDLQLFILGLNFAWEEFFAFFLGDFTTNKIFVWHRQLGKSLHHSITRTHEDLVDYIQEEKRFLPTREEVEDFYEEVINLRQMLDRFEARLQRFEESLS